MTDEPAPSLAAQYRALALDAYAAARLIVDPTEKGMMHQIALGYENLASNAEDRERAAQLAALAGAPDPAPTGRT
jgi:hypothetical protein